MRRPQGRGCVAAQERLQPGVGGDDRGLVGRVARSAPEERGPGGGEAAVEGLERAAVEDEPAPRRGAQRIERHGVEVAGHRGARVDVGAEEALEGFDAPVELATEGAAEPAGEDRREVEGNERAPQHLMVRDGPAQCVGADREVGVVLGLREGEPRVERLGTRREREGHVGVGPDHRGLPTEASAGHELVDDVGIRGAVEGQRGRGDERPDPGHVELGRGGGRGVDRDHVGHETGARRLVDVAELHLERVHAVALAADAEAGEVELHRAHAVGVGGEVVERDALQGEGLRERRAVAETGVERTARQDAVVDGERELQAFRVPARLDAHREDAGVRGPGVLRGERERGGVRVGLGRGRNRAHARAGEATDDERGEDGDGNAPAHSARPMTARPVGRM